MARSIGHNQKQICVIRRFPGTEAAFRIFFKALIKKDNIGFANNYCGHCPSNLFAEISQSLGKLPMHRRGERFGLRYEND
ncbi:MAG: hypothetical protein AB3N20_18685 [Rhizobiaceae bacterium]